MIWKKIFVGIVLLIFYLSPLSTLATVVAGKTFNARHAIGLSIVFVSFLIAVMLWVKDFSGSDFAFLKNYSIISKVLITILCFYATALIITYGLR